jgi:hypothetical protein
MEEYHADYLKSRHLSIGDQIFCEFCGKFGAQVHHILSSFRGKRKNNPD